MLTHSAYGSSWGGLQGPPWPGPRTSACISSPCHLGHSSARPGVLLPPNHLAHSLPSFKSVLRSPFNAASPRHHPYWGVRLPLCPLVLTYRFPLPCAYHLLIYCHIGSFITFTVYFRLPLHENVSFFLLFMEVSRCSVNTWGRSELTIDFVLFSLVQ